MGYKQVWLAINYQRYLLHTERGEHSNGVVFRLLSHSVEKGTWACMQQVVENRGNAPLSFWRLLQARLPLSEAAKRQPLTSTPPWLFINVTSETPISLKPGSQNENECVLQETFILSNLDMLIFWPTMLLRIFRVGLGTADAETRSTVENLEWSKVLHLVRGSRTGEVSQVQWISA